MYTAYFGLKEKPFSIAPDPQYLFMSDRHREALAHLTYGLGDAGGFVLLTGEVGTGKTTVSRCLMERLPENTQAAFILNPTLSCHELLATICDELKIRYRKTGATLKTLTDKIQDKLLNNHKNNMNTLLIIDEAQHLQPEVLEQLRLLTNLETNTKKLLQVILIGQPELQVLLRRRDLRQLAQRITARYHLLPLNKQEVAQYIKHRLSIAECIRAIFTPSAMKALHDICGGVPRLINLVSERSLINAYGANLATVDKKIVILSAQEALGDEYQVNHWWQSSVIRWVAIILVLCVVAASAFILGSNKNNSLQEWLLLTKENEVVNNSLLDDSATEVLTNAAIDEEKKEALLGNKEPTTSQITSINKSIDNRVPSVKSVIEKQSTIEAINSEKQIAIPEKIETVSNSQPNIISKKTFEASAVKGVSNELLNTFNQAIKSSKNNNEPNTRNYNSSLNDKDVEPIENMPAWVQNGIPTLQFDQHIYASDGEGWVRVNGRDRYEGDNIGRELVLVRILPQKVILNFRGEKFTMSALSSW